MTAVPVERATTLSDRIAEEIRVLLTRRRMSQRQLAAVLGVSPAWLNYRLTGVQEIGVNDMQQIADAFGVPVTDLLPDDLRPGQRGDDPIRRSDRINRTCVVRHPKRRKGRPNKRSTSAPTHSATPVHPSQRRPNPLRPGERRIAR